MRQELPDAFHAPAAVRIVADVTGAGRKYRRLHRSRVLAWDVDDPLVEVGRSGSRLEYSLDVEAEGVSQRVGHTG